ncbi:MAG: hypothetical protein KFH98_09055, partial [Gemmatimonadetes bacterium]|nr:hypothetical protein [Gemmatimonadota bacterium]
TLAPPRMTSRLLFLLLFLAPALAAGQVPAGTATQVREHVAGVSDTLQLHAIEQQFVRSAAASAGLERRVAAANAGVAAGLSAFRLWEITGERAHARRARGHFDRAAGNDAANAWAHYGHALSLEPEMDRDPGLIVTHINASRALGLDPVSRARRALERAVALDPSLPGAPELLARYAIATRDDDGLIQARTSFQMSVAGSHSASGLVGLAMTSRELGDYVAAADAARRAVASDSSSARAHVELAMALAMIDDSLPAAGRAWETAVGLADGAMLGRMWDDAAVLHTERDSAQWRAADTPRRRTLLRAFWGVRAALSGVDAGERAAEHYRRLGVAFRDFPRRGMFGAAPVNALRLRKTSTEYDDRGVIYIRHGEPDRTHGEPPLQNYIAWFYTDAAGDPLSYHFEKSDQAGASRDYLLMHNLPCAMDPMIAAFDSRLTALTKQSCDPLLVRSVSAVINRDAERALRTDTHAPAFVHALPFHFDWYTFRAAGGTEILMGIGVPFAELPRDLRSLRMRLSVIDTTDISIAQTSLVTRPFTRDDAAGDSGRGRVLRTHLAMTLAPGSAVYRIDVRDAADARSGTIYGGDIELPDYSSDTLMVSDVMLAEQADDGSVTRGDARLALAPTQVFRAGEFRVYYEIYNIAEDAPFSTEMTIEPLRRGGLREGIRGLFRGNESVQLRFEGTAAPDASGSFPQLHDITAPFRDGAWLLRVTITTGAGVITRERRFMIDAR